VGRGFVSGKRRIEEALASQSETGGIGGGNGQ
jgi:hypothetical protein